MVLACDDILNEDFSSAGNNCEAIPIIFDNLESIAAVVCELRCDSQHIVSTDDCSMSPDDFVDLFPSCVEAPPSNAVVIQACSCAQGGVKIYVWDEGDLVWRRLGKEFAVGETGDFVDPNNPTAVELTALFGTAIANEALVIVRPTREIWFTGGSCGASWTLLQDVPPIGADVQNHEWNESFFQDGSTGTFTEIFDHVLYSNGSSGSFPIAQDDLIDLTVVYGYTIVTTDGVNPVDNINMKFRISGPVTQFDTDYGTTSGGQLIRNGLMYAEFNMKLRATQAGNLRMRIYETAGGSSDDTQWQWRFHVARSSVSIQRA